MANKHTPKEWANSPGIRYINEKKRDKTKANTNKWDLIKLKRFVQQMKPFTQKEKTNYLMGENICERYDQ